MPTFSTQLVGSVRDSIIEDADVLAYRVTDDNGTPLNPNDDLHAYFYTLACANTFLSSHPEFVHNGKVLVDESTVIICF